MGGAVFAIRVFPGRVGVGLLWLGGAAAHGGVRSSVVGLLWLWHSDGVVYEGVRVGFC